MHAEKLENHLEKIHRHQETDFRWRNLRGLVKKYLKDGTVLDIGCGTGHMTLELLHRGYTVTSIDISPKLINFTRNIVEKSGFDVDAKAMDARDVKTLGKSSFDNILCLDVLEHIENDVEVLKRLEYVLKNEGRLIISVPALKFLFGKRDREIGHFR